MKRYFKIIIPMFILSFMLLIIGCGKKIIVSFETNGGNTIESIEISAGSEFDLPNDPEREGYTFDGWYLDEELKNSFSFAAVAEINTDYKIYAAWKINQYTITFETNGGNVIENVKYNFSDVLELPTPEKEGSTFRAWYSDKNLTNEFRETEMPANDITLYAGWNGIEYTITFETNGGSNVESINALYNDAITAPLSPVKAGHTFAGWYSDSALTKEFAFEKMPNKSFTLYAKWDVNEYKVEFRSDDVNFKEVNVKYNNKVESFNNPEKSGYTFAGWYYQNSEEQFNFDTVVTENLVLVAKWNINSYTVTFDTNGGNTIGSMQFIYNTKLTGIATPEKLGYEFTGWTYNGEYFDLNNNTMPAENITLKASWSVKAYSIIFETNSDDIINSLNVNYGSAIPTLSNPKKVGYTFVAWCSDSDLNVIFTEETMPANNITLYAKYIANEYQIEFDGDGAEGQMTSIKVKYDEEVTLPFNTFDKTGCSFNGWTYSQNLYQDGAKVKNLATEGVVTLKATWIKDDDYKYSIEFETNSDTVINEIKLPAGAQIILPANPEKEGHLFVGWYTDSELTNEFTLTEMPENNVVLYAKWAISEYTITFVTNNGVAVDPITVKYNEVISELPTTEKEGNEFVGWYLDASLTQEFNLVNMPGRNLVLYAKWEVAKYTVTFVIDGEEVKLNDVQYGTLLSTLDIPDATVIGYTFVGWYDQDRVLVNGNNITTYAIREDVTFTAELSANTYTINFVSEGKVLASLNKKYGEAVSFKEYVDGIKSQIDALNELNDAIKEAVGGSLEKLQTILMTQEKLGVLMAISESLATSLNNLLYSYSTNSSDLEVRIQELYSISTATVSDLSSVYNLYVKNNYKPVKEGYVFNNWVLGADAIYEDTTEGSVFAGFAPASISGSVVNIVANWSKLQAVSGISFDSEKNTLSWSAIDVSSLLEANESAKITYQILSYVGEGLDYILLATTTDTSKKFTAPGVYNVVIKAICTIVDSEGNELRVVETENQSTNFEFSVVIKDVQTDILSSGDYYYKAEEDGQEIFIFFTNMDYTFPESNNFVLTDSEGNPLDDGSPYVEFNKNQIVTCELTGEFYFQAKEGGMTYLGRVYPFVSQFDFGLSLSSYITNATTSNTQYLNTADSIYSIGGNIEEMTKSDYANNGFLFDLTITASSGRRIDYLKYNKYLDYTFYAGAYNTLSALEGVEPVELGVYDKNTGAWNFNANSGVYTVVIKIGDTYLPKYLIENNYISPKMFTFQLNNCVNVFSHETLKEVFADTTFRDGINIHKEIKAKINETQKYTDAAYAANNVQLTYSDTEGLKDGSPINTRTSKIFTGGETGNVYVRKSNVDLNETYQINGNYFKIDGSDLPHASVYSLDNLSSVPGYEIADTQIAIFRYVVNDIALNADNTTGDSALLENSNSTLVVNDLTIFGNTKTPSVNFELDSDKVQSAITLMNKNSGGYSGIRGDMGSNVVIDNCVIANTTIAIYLASRGTVNVNYAYVYSSWANTLYAYGAKTVTVSNSHIKDSGGAAIHVSDIYSTVDKLDDQVLNLNANNRIENYVSGEEAWFRSYNMELAVMAMKTGLEAGVSSQGFTAIDVIKDPVTGIESEKINFISLLTPEGDNRSNEDNKGTVTANTTINIINDVYADPMFQANGSVNFSSMVAAGNFSAIFPTKFDASYAPVSATLIQGLEIPLYGNSILICEIKQK